MSRPPEEYRHAHVRIDKIQTIGLTGSLDLGNCICVKPEGDNTADLGHSDNRFKDLYVGGVIKYRSSCGETWGKNNVNATNISQPNIWTNLVFNQPKVGNNTDDMTVTSQQNNISLKYTGSNTKKFKLGFTFSARFESTNTPQYVRFGVFKNGALISKTEVAVRLDNINNNPRNAYISTIQSFNQNDTLSIRLKTTNTMDNVVVESFNLNIFEILNAPVSETVNEAPSIDEDPTETVSNTQRIEELESNQQTLEAQIIELTNRLNSLTT